MATMPRTVEAEVNYVGPMDSMPFWYAKDHDRDNLDLEPHRVAITNAREADPPLTLDRDGLQLVTHQTAVRDFFDADHAGQVYPGEVEALIKRLTGADHAKATRIVLRFSEADRRPEYVNSLPARFVHVDYSRASFDSFAASYAADHPEREALLADRYAAFNVWRVLSPPPQDIPLAVCAASSVGPQEPITGESRVDGGKEEYRFQSSVFRASPAHRWYYYRDMRPDEALIFKSFDSDRSRLQCCPHVAFNDPSAPPDAPPRASAEIRVFAYWKE